MAVTRFAIVAELPARAAPARPHGRAARQSFGVRVMAKIGYARVSTRGQKDDSQVDDLTAYGCDKIFTARRPASSPSARLSRAMRSLKHLLALADQLR